MPEGDTSELKEVKSEPELEELESEPKQKEIDDYEYRIKVHDADDTNVTLLLEEVDGNDGFAVTFPIEEIEPIITDADALRKKLEPYVENRIELLKSVKEEEDTRKIAKENIEIKLKKVGEVKVRKTTKTVSEYKEVNEV